MKPRVFWSVLSHDSSNVLLTRGYFWFTTRLRVPRLFDVGRSVGSTSSVRRRRSVGGVRVADEQTPFVCHPPSDRASASARCRRVTNDRTRTDPKRHVACRRARPSPVRRTTEATVKTYEDDGRSVRGRASSARSARAATRHEGRRDGRTERRTPRRVGSGRWEIL